MHFEGLDESVRKESGDIYKTRKEKSTHIALVDRGDKNPQFHLAANYTTRTTMGCGGSVRKAQF